MSHTKMKVNFNLMEHSTVHKRMYEDHISYLYDYTSKAVALEEAKTSTSLLMELKKRETE